MDKNNQKKEAVATKLQFAQLEALTHSGGRGLGNLEGCYQCGAMNHWVRDCTRTRRTQGGRWTDAFAFDGAGDRVRSKKVV